MPRLTSLCAPCVLVLLGGCAAPANDARATSQPVLSDDDQRMRWWREARFGMFVHWGLYAIPAGEWNGKRTPSVSEWLMYHMRIPAEEYEPLAARFNPVDFDADEWADLAADAGMRYIVITSKHHDGFALFDSAASEYDIIDASPYETDIMGEIRRAFRERDLRVGWYHSILDWHHPDANQRDGWGARPEGADWDNYRDTKLIPQVRELLTNYGTIDVVWFDGEWIGEWTEEQGRELYDLCRELQPDTLVNNRVGKGRQGMGGLTAEGAFAGDFGTPEQEVPASGLPGVDWESCMTMNDSWGYKHFDHNFKSTKQLVRTLVDVASKGGNLLLNVGPDARGRIPEESATRLREMGAWLDVHGEGIYGTEAGLLTSLPWGRSTTRRTGGETAVYLHVFDWPDDGRLLVRGLATMPRSVRRLGDEASAVAEWSDSRQESIVLLGASSPVHEACSVYELRFKGDPEVVTIPLRAGEDGALVAGAIEATISGHSLRYEADESKQCLGFWTSAEASASWPIELAPGVYRVEIELACQPGDAGSTYALSIGDQAFIEQVEATASWTDFVTVDLGTITLTGEDARTLRVSPVEIPHNAMMNLRRIRLTPVR